MPSSPEFESNGIVTVKVIINGTPVRDEYQLYSLEVNNAIGVVPSATIVLLESADPPFKLSSSNDFIPGNKVEIRAGYADKTDTIFEGLIIRQGIKADYSGGPQLIVHCQDEAVKMTLGRKMRAFTEQTDAAILETVISAYGLDTEIAATGYTFPQLLQTDTTDWDFAASRAAANGMLLYAGNGKVFVQRPLARGAAKLVVTYGEDIYSFEADLDAGDQLPGVATAGWDFTHGEVVEYVAQEPQINRQGNLSAKQLAEVIGAESETVRLTTPLKEAELKATADGRLLRDRLKALHGRVTFRGNASPKLNTLIELEGLGDRFNGSALITSVSHTISEGRWLTETGFGLSPDRHTAPAGNGLLPAVSGLQNGVVKQIYEDPDNEHRILVTLPVLGTDVWARQTSPYATRGKGSFFLPETGDEVIVGFLNDDPRFAVILGGVYSSKNAPPYPADKQNTFKAIVSREGLRIELNETDKVVTVATPGGNSVVLSDQDRSVVLEDQNGNSVAMDSGGISLKSPRDIILAARGKITLTAEQQVDVRASGGDVSLEGMNLRGKGDVSVELKGGASAELSAAGETTVKGAMVKIN